MELADALMIDCPTHGRTGPLATSVRCGKCAESDRQELLRLRGELSLAREGLANAMQELQITIEHRDALLREVERLHACWAEALGNYARLRGAIEAHQAAVCDNPKMAGKEADERLWAALQPEPQAAGK
jgi:hypothetical protein